MFHPCLVFWSSFTSPYVLRLKPRSPCLQLQIGRFQPVVITAGHTQSLQWGKKQLRVVVCGGCYGWCVVVSPCTRSTFLARPFDILSLEHFVDVQGITVCLPCIICQAFSNLMKLSFFLFFFYVLLSGRIITIVFFSFCCLHSLLLIQTMLALVLKFAPLSENQTANWRRESILWEVRERWSLWGGQEREWEGGEVITEVSWVTR